MLRYKLVACAHLGRIREAYVLLQQRLAFESGLTIGRLKTNPGDHRYVPICQHMCGRVPQGRIAGGVIPGFSGCAALGLWDRPLYLAPAYPNYHDLEDAIGRLIRPAPEIAR